MMPCQVVNVPLGAPQLFRPGPIPWCVEAVPAATGTVLIEVSRDNGTTFVAQPIGAVATVNSAAGQGDYGTVVKVTAGTAAATAVLMNLSTTPGGGQWEFLMNPVPYTTQVTLTTELELVGIRFPVGSLKQAFRIEYDLMFSCTNNANVKTIRTYFGNSANTALEGGTIAATQVLTSSSGAQVRGVLVGRNDNSSVTHSNIGVSGAGWGINTTAGITISSSVAYSGPNAVEQALVISYQKATAADALTLDAVVARLIQ